MNFENRWLPGLGLGLLLWGAEGTASGQVAGGPFRLRVDVVGGGGTSLGGPYTLRGAVSQGAVGRSTSVIEPGGVSPDFRLIGGWLGPSMNLIPIRPVMRVRFTDDKLAELNWDVDITGYVLEFSSRIGPDADWEPVSPQPVGTRFTTPCAQPARYFRLRSL